MILVYSDDKRCVCCWPHWDHAFTLTYRRHRWSRYRVSRYSCLTSRGLRLLRFVVFALQSQMRRKQAAAYMVCQILGTRNHPLLQLSEHPRASKTDEGCSEARVRIPPQLTSQNSVDAPSDSRHILQQIRGCPRVGGLLRNLPRQAMNCRSSLNRNGPSFVQTTTRGQAIPLSSSSSEVMTNFLISQVRSCAMTCH